MVLVVVISSEYLLSHTLMSVSRFRLCLLCLQSKVNVISSASPSDPPIPAPMPAWAPFDDDDFADVPEIKEPFTTDDVAAMYVVKVAVVLTVPEAVFVVLRDVEPDVGLNITGPASIENGDVLRLVRLMQLLVAESA